MYVLSLKQKDLPHLSWIDFMDLLEVPPQVLLLLKLLSTNMASSLRHLNVHDGLA